MCFALAGGKGEGREGRGREGERREEVSWSGRTGDVWTRLLAAAAAVVVVDTVERLNSVATAADGVGTGVGSLAVDDGGDIVGLGLHGCLRTFMGRC